MKLDAGKKQITLIRYTPPGVVLPVLITNDGPSVILIYGKEGLTGDPHGPSSVDPKYCQLVYPKDEGQDSGSLVIALKDGGRSAEFWAEFLPPCTAGKA